MKKQIAAGLLMVAVTVTACSNEKMQSSVPDSASSQVSLSKGEPASTPELKSESVESHKSGSSSQKITEPIIPPDLDDLENLKKSYLFPIVFSGSTMKSWTDANTLNAKNFIMMYGYAQVWNADIPESEMIFEEDTPYYYVNADIVENYVKKYFSISTEHLRSSDEYNEQKHAYKFNMSGVGFAYDPYIKRAEYNDAKKELILYLDGGYEENRKEASALTILLKEDGDFLYTSNNYYEK